MEMGRQKKRRKQRKRKHQRQRKQKAATAAAPMRPGEIWSSTYQSLVQWHQAQVRSFCRGQVEQQCSSEAAEEAAAKEEQKLETELELDEVPDEVELEEVPDEVDAEYLNFLEVTLQHQEQLKSTRAAAAELCLQKPAVNIV